MWNQFLASCSHLVFDFLTELSLILKVGDFGAGVTAQIIPPSSNNPGYNLS